MIVASEDDLRRALSVINKGVSIVARRSVSVLIVGAFVVGLTIDKGEVRLDRLGWLCGSALDILWSCLLEADVDGWRSRVGGALCPRPQLTVRALTTVVVAIHMRADFDDLG